MLIYFFNLKTARGDIRDPEGAELADDAAAWEHARQVARELMRRREHQARSWRLDVRDSEGRQHFELLFASVDESLMVLGPEMRNVVENLHRKHASLIDAISAVRLSLGQMQKAIAGSNEKPSLASLDEMTIAACESAGECRRDDDARVATISMA